MSSEPSSDLDTIRSEVADACRVLAARGLADGLLGHVSVRVDAEHVLVRCRGPRERGLAHTEPADVRLVDLDGRGDLVGGYRVPAELPLHTEVLRHRPDVGAVVHAHPFAVVAADLAGQRIRPILGAYDIPGAWLARRVRCTAGGAGPRTQAGRRDAGRDGQRPVVILRGHGLTATGDGPVQAVLRALSVDVLARMILTVAQAGGRPAELPAADFAELPDLGSAFNETTAWRHELARLRS